MFVLFRIETQETRYKELFEMCIILVFKVEVKYIGGLGKEKTIKQE
jgi:hypothetical protein